MGYAVITGISISMIAHGKKMKARISLYFFYNNIHGSIRRTIINKKKFNIIHILSF